MNLHSLLDNITAWTGALAAGKNKFFSNSIESPSFQEYFKQIALNFPDFTKEKKYEVSVEKPFDYLDPAFLVYKWLGHDYPTIIFHHGNNEDPFDMSLFASHSFKMIFKSNRDAIDANIIAVRAPFHGGSLKEYTSRIKNLANFTALLAASVILVGELINRLRKISDQQILVSGISLGGWVTNLHRSYFNSADTYVPLLAGAALAEVFLSSKYKKLTGELPKHNPEKIRDILNFEKAFDKVKSNNVSPLLGLYDQFIQYERQKKCYQERYPIKTLKKGHVTSLLASQKLYYHIIDNY